MLKEERSELICFDSYLLQIFPGELHEPGLFRWNTLDCSNFHSPKKRPLMWREHGFRGVTSSPQLTRVIRSDLLPSSPPSRERPCYLLSPIHRTVFEQLQMRLQEHTERLKKKLFTSQLQYYCRSVTGDESKNRWVCIWTAQKARDANGVRSKRRARVWIQAQFKKPESRPDLDQSAGKCNLKSPMYWTKDVRQISTGSMMFAYCIKSLWPRMDTSSNDGSYWDREYCFITI